MNTTFNLIDQAIKNKNVITFTYDGYQRTAEPHHYGILNDKDQLHAYQIGGESKSRKPVNWKNFEIGKIKELILTNDTFEVRSSHHPSGSKYSEIKKSVSK
jgi:predicted DNA-binding transcriptional regulator YafY